jgi:hypothetical protein
MKLLTDRKRQYSSLPASVLEESLLGSTSSHEIWICATQKHSEGHVINIQEQAGLNISVGDYRLFGMLPLRRIYNFSDQIGKKVSKILGTQIG